MAKGARTAIMRYIYFQLFLRYQMSIDQINFRIPPDNYRDLRFKLPVLGQNGLKGSLYNDRQERWG